MTLLEKIQFLRRCTRKIQNFSFGLNKFDPTFVHYVEQFFDQNIKKIKYRKRLKFKGIIKIKKRKKNSNPLLFYETKKF